MGGDHRRVAVIGSGVAGLTAAHVAGRQAGVTLYEADDRFGGHADTHLVDEGGRTLAIDTGFIVHNRRTYPTLLRLFAELGVPTQESEMSMSTSDEGTGLEWAGALGRRGVFPSRRHLLDPAYLRMLTEVPRFHRRARALLADGAGSTGPSDDQTLREFLRAGGFTPYFERHFMEPLVAAVWSCDPAVALDYPARYLFSFLEHHGMLQVFGSPTWRTVTGGSHEYVRRVVAGIADPRPGTKVTSVVETPDGVEVTDGNGATEVYDGVVVATHPGQALALLAEPTPLQREVLAALPYSANTALLHTDTSLLPRNRNTWASWNFRRPVRARAGEVTVTYDLTRLQRLRTDTHYLVTLGGEHLVDPATVIARREYEHPLYTPASVAAQARLPEISTDRVAFAGAYHGWGFHEDGARSGLAAVERLGFGWDDDPARPAPPVEAETGVYETTIRHTRRTPFRRSFTHRSHTWLVDLDDLPDHGVLARFEARDHLGDPGRSIRANVEAFLARHDIDLDGGRVLLAANARAFGYCFNPISVFWCHDRSGDLAAAVVEVHNTYGDRHAYLVHPDAQGRAEVDKAMYVSPFHGTDGRYELAVPVPGDRLDVAVTLHASTGTFSASLSGRRMTAGAWRAAPAALRGSLLIRAHGIWLWVRRLPVRPRPAHHQEGV
ncbi:FAD-dependent oxidoreductase [Nocardioides taihuensis]|uniref:FAD-dependent oxidoreductase n=1 Tax=Nocardioides taihuensis TaxID=1835606 RepID=A0ABW0BHZ3_9ACTN